MLLPSNRNKMKYAMIYTLLMGPILWISLLLGLAGIVLKIFRLLRMSTASDMPGKYALPPLGTWSGPGATSGSPVPLSVRFRIAVKNSLPGRDPFLAAVTTVFHGCLMVTPLFLTAHNVLLFQSWRLRTLSMPEALADVFAATVIASAFLLLLRRIFLKRVRMLTSFGDNTALAVAVAPFVTGMLAYHQAGPYDMMIILHILSGEILIIALGWSRLSHAVFFFFTRFMIGGEYALGGGRRSWMIDAKEREGLYG